MPGLPSVSKGRGNGATCYDRRMAGLSQELIAIVLVGIGLAGLILHLGKRIDRLDVRLLAVEKEQARTFGLLEGLGLTGRAEPSPGHGD